MKASGTKHLAVTFPASLLLGSLSIALLSPGCDSSNSHGPLPAKPDVSVTNLGQYYSVRIDYTSASPYAIGQEYGRLALQAFPTYERTADSYLADTVAILKEFCEECGIDYEELIRRAVEINKQIKPAYQEELEGFASTLSGGRTNVMGDGKLSLDEYLVLNLTPDIATADACSAVAVYGDRAQTGHTIVGRNMDWFPGFENQFGKMHAVVHAITAGQEYLSIGFLGQIGSGTGINSKGLYIANLYSDIGEEYSAVGRRSVQMDIRDVLETASTIDQAADYFGDAAKLYGYNHIMFMANKDVTKVQENYLAGDRRRELRTTESALREGVLWEFSDAIASVNSFLLPWNPDNHFLRPDTQGLYEAGTTDFNLVNIFRWNNFREQMAQRGPVVDFAGVKTMMSYHAPQQQDLDPGTDPGDIFNTATAQSIVYSFGDNRLEAYLIPGEPGFDDNPVYTPILMPFKPGAN